MWWAAWRIGGGEWERALFELILEHADVFSRLPDYAHEALVAAHLQHATPACNGR